MLGDFPGNGVFIHYVGAAAAAGEGDLKLGLQLAG